MKSRQTDDPIKKKIAAGIEQLRFPRYDEIPGVGLYLEQTVNYIAEYLDPLQQGALTASMVSNYVKKKLVPNPVRKMYGREQIAILFFIAGTKPVLSLEDIRVLLSIKDAHYDSRTAYNFFCDEIESVIRSVFGLDEGEENPAPAKQSEKYAAEEKAILHNTVIAVAHKIYLEKWITLYASQQQESME